MTEAQKFCLSCCREESIDLFFKTPEKWYLDSEEHKIRLFVKEYFGDYSKLPTDKTVLSKFKIKGEYDGDPEYYYGELNNRFVYVTVSEQIAPFVKGFKKDPRKQFDEFRSFINSVPVDASKGREVNYADTAEERIELYKQKVGTKGITYLSTGDELLDNLFVGWDETDLVTIGGRPGTGKTWFLLYLIVCLETVLPENFGPIMLVSMEMSEKQISERLDAMKYKLPYNDFIRGELSAPRQKKYERSLKRLKRTGSPILILDDIYTLAELESKAIIHSPSIIFVDGSYILEPEMEEGYGKTTFITRNLKRVAKQQRTPIINTTQLRKNAGKRKGETAVDRQDEFYHGSYTQDSDLAISSYITSDLEYHSKIAYNIAKGRRVSNTEFIYKNDLFNMEFYTELEEEFEEDFSESEDLPT